MVDVNTSRSALQAQLQASQQSKVGSRASYTPDAQRDAFQRKLDDRPDLIAPDRRAPAKPGQQTNQLSSSQDIENASRKAAEFGSNLREAPNGRTSQTSLGPARNQPLGQIINILV